MGWRTVPSYVLKRRLCSSSWGRSTFLKKASTFARSQALSPEGIGGIVMVTDVVKVTTAVAVASRHFCPTGQLHPVATDVFRLAIALLPPSGFDSVRP